MDKINTQSFDELLSLEHDAIKNRRAQANSAKDDPKQDSTALCLSGGGIRSATFNLGLLQAMERQEQLKHVDYLSTVSGGGYIGSSLTWFLSAFKNQTFPFGTRRSQNSGDQGKILAWLRGHGNYLTPGEGLNLWALIAAVLTGTLINLAILVPVFLLLIYLLSKNSFGTGLFLYHILPLTNLYTGTGFDWLIEIGVLLIGLYLFSAVVYSFATAIQKCRCSEFQREMRKISGVTLAGGVVLLVIGSIPGAYSLASDWLHTIISTGSLSGFISIVVAYKTRGNGNESKGWRSFALTSGLSLLIYGMFLWFYHSVHYYPSIPVWLCYALGLSGLLALFANINHVSMHRFYRNRLMEAYLPDDTKILDLDSFQLRGDVSADNYSLSTIKQDSARPYHIINTNIQLTGSKIQKYRLRGGDNFIFSPHICGSSATGYVKTGNYVGGLMNLATACAISGAAVDPNNYMTRSRPLTFLMTLFNARLGYWIRNPKHPASIFGRYSRPRWYWYIFREMFGRGLDEECWHSHLSDGGHFENLAMYEMVRRNCRWIVVSDAGADPEYYFSDLARVIELVRTDFGAKIAIDIDEIKPSGDNKLSKLPYAVGKIEYNNGMEGNLIYIKTSLINGLQEDIYSYQRQHPQFPNEPTSDQFFNEFQFEAYRELGYQIGCKVFEQIKLND